MLLLILYWTIMLICYAAASKLRGYAEKFSFIDQALNLVIYLLVCVMGCAWERMKRLHRISEPSGCSPF